MDDLTGWEFFTAKNGAFGYRTAVVGLTHISGAGKTETLARASAERKLREHIADMQAKGTPLAPPAPQQPFRLLDLLAAADATESEPAKSQRAENKRWKDELATVNADVESALKDTIVLEGFATPLSYAKTIHEDGGGATIQANAFATSEDLDVVIACLYRLSRVSGRISVDQLEVGLNRKSTKRSAQRALPIKVFAGEPAIDLNDVRAALSDLVVSVSYAAEPLDVIAD